MKSNHPSHQLIRNSCVKYSGRVLLFVLALIQIGHLGWAQKRNLPASQAPILQWSTTTTGDTVSALGQNIDCMLQAQNGDYWFGSNGDGVYRYNGKTLIRFTERSGLCSNFILNIQEDRKGNLWLTTREGFCRYNGKSFTDFTHYITNAPYGKLPALRDGLFFGHLKGICYSDGQNFTNFTIQPVDYRPLPHDWNRPYSMYSALIDQAGILWLGTQSKGVCRYDGKTPTYLVDKDLAGPAVRTLFQDKKGILWFGNNGGGLYRYDGKTLSNITEEKGLGNPEFLKGQLHNKPGSLARVFSIHEDRAGNLWIGTIDAGLWRYDGTTLLNYTTKDGLPGNSIWKIYKDKAGELWFVVNGHWVCTFNGKTFTKQLFH